MEEKTQLFCEALFSPIALLHNTFAPTDKVPPRVATKKTSGVQIAEAERALLSRKIPKIV